MTAQSIHQRLLLLLWGFVGVLAIAVCYYSLGHYDHNDHMYAVAPILAQHARLYTDFAFVQTPLSVLVFGQILNLAGAAHLYMALRIFSLVLNLAIVVFGILLCRRHAGAFAPLLFAGLYLWLHQAEIIGAENGNYTLTLFLIALTLLCFDTLRGKTGSPLLVGLFAGLALSAKLSSIFVVIVFAILYLRRGQSLRETAAALGLFAVGALAGCLPILYY